jgi:hypothetical protein
MRFSGAVRPDRGAREVRGGEGPCLQPKESNGFVVDEAQVTFFGLCGECSVRGAGLEP